ncbi:MAG: hypothetical protein HZA53_14095 [Planctomycetes bacterium]|nr:hypothetical protein [Planctomycetota bacterium]
MSPRIRELDRCAHCRVELPRPTPRMCPACGGSLQKRHLSIGCLSSAPLFLVAAGAIAAGIQAAWRAPAGAARGGTSSESVAIERERP